MRFHSILTGSPGDMPASGERPEPAFFCDLHLDQVLDAMTAGREEYDLKPFFYVPLHSADAVAYRHEVLRDLENEPVARAITGFGRRMKEMRGHLAQAGKLHYAYQKERWFLDAVQAYCDAVSSLASDLASLELGSRGLAAFREYLAGYVASRAFTALTGETARLYDDLAGVRYSIHIRGNRVRVSRYDDEPDYSADVEKTFAKFKEGAARDYRVGFRSAADMNHVEARVLDLVARLYPGVFGALDEYCARNDSYIDETIGSFDREVQFYLAYLEFIEPFRKAGLDFCYPAVSAESKEVAASGAFDLALAASLMPSGTLVVRNDFELSGPERILVVTGPNQGGKTTFARMFGQLHYLASIGYLVPGREARLFLPDRLYTHFEREEDIETLRGKLEDELVRIHQVLDEATSDSVVVANESFSSTTLQDALFLGTQVLRDIIQRDVLAVYVTFVDELASLSESTVSMMSTVAEDNPAVRTYKVIRKPADGLAYAGAIADKYGLTYRRLTERLAPGDGHGATGAGAETGRRAP